MRFVQTADELSDSNFFGAASTNSCIVSIWVPPTASFKLDSSPISSYLNCCFKAEQISPPHNSSFKHVYDGFSFTHTGFSSSNMMSPFSFFRITLLFRPRSSISGDDRPEIITSWKRGGREDSYPKKLKWGTWEFTRAYRKINTQAKPGNWKCAHVPEPASEALC